LISEVERKVLAAVQRLPLVPEPYGEVATRLGMTEDEVIDICNDLITRGAIRRIAPSVSHRKFGFSANPMCVLNVPEDRLEEVGTLIASDRRVTHAYARDGWKYNVFFMVHGKTREEGIEVAEEIIQRTGIQEYQLFFSTRELKKTSFELPTENEHLKKDNHTTVDEIPTENNHPTENELLKEEDHPTEDKHPAEGGLIREDRA
jgi:siroheme decarboxylase